VLRETLQKWEGEVVIGGRKINNLRFADETTLCAKSEIEMSQLLKCTEESSNKYGLKINSNKTKVMVIDRAGVLLPTTVLNNYQKLEEFIYLGLLIEANDSSSREIRRQITLGREAVSRLIPIWKDNHISKNSKMKLLRALTFTVMLYGSETWTLKAEDIKHINAFEM